MLMHYIKDNNNNYKFNRGWGQVRGEEALCCQFKAKKGQVRGEEALCCQFKAIIDLKLVFSRFLPDVLTGWPIPPKSSLINQ
jgi:hypothetical protein